ncbi:MAG TPA: tetratricopeptide repeat protein, partial [Firmicutes bacterium]|nr:tetratricopeptide repeat protein [Bacillota bacterium]
HIRRRDLASASQVCEQALGRWPEDPDLLLWKVKILAGQGDFEGALSVFRQLQERAPLDARYLLVLARLAIEQGHPKEAMATLGAAVALAPDNPEPYLRLAELYARQGAFPQAEEKLKQAEKRLPGHVGVPLAYGDLLANRGEHERAMAKYQQALKVRPGNLQAIARLGRELLAAGRVEAVGPLIQEATLAKGRSEVALQLANEARARDQLATAEQLYQMALQHPASAVPAQVGLARIAAARRDKEQALQYFEAAAQSASPSMRFLLLLGAGDVASASWGEPSPRWRQDLLRAEKYYEEASQIPSQPAFLALFRRAGVAWAKGNDAAAEEYLEKAVAERPEDEILQLLLAQAREKSGKSLQARQITEKLLTAVSDAADPLSFLSQLGRRLKALIGSDTDVRYACLGRKGDYIREFLLGVSALEAAPSAGALLTAPPRREETPVKDLQEAAWRQALSHFERVRQIQPASPLGFWSAAAVLPALGQADRATALLREWLQQHPADPLTRIELARVSARAGDFSQALEEVDRVLEQEPAYVKALLVKAGLLSSPEVNRPEQAASILAEFLRSQPGHTGAALSLISILHGQGKVQEAINAGESFLAANPENTAVISQLAGIYLERQDYPKALEWYEKALKLTPNSPGALNNLAYAYAQ